MERPRHFCLLTALLYSLVSSTSALDDFYFSRHPQDLAVREGGSVDLECMVSNTSYIRFYWQLDGETLANSSRRYQRGSDLHISRVDRKKDAGHFTCIAMNVTTGFSLTSLAASLNILWLDPDTRVQLQSPSSPSAVRPGADVVLRCRVDGSGDIGFSWFRNGRRLQRGPRLQLRNRRLQLSAVEPRDGGVYTCAASNDAGTATSTAALVLNVPGAGAPLVTVVPRDQLVRRRTTARFQCQYSGADAVEWWFQGRKLPSNTRKYTVLSNHTLLVAEAGERDQGWYHCRARVRADETLTQEYSAQLTLAYLAPLTVRSVEPAPPVEGLQVAPQGRPLQLTCLPPEGRPPPRLWWEEPSGRVVNVTAQAAAEGAAVLTLAAARPQDSGNYSCVAENIAGTHSVQVQLLVAAPPELVSGPASTVVEEGQRSELHCLFRGLHHPLFSMFWLKDGHPLKTPELVHVEPVEGGATVELAIPLTQLTDAGRYQCAVNSTGFPTYRSPQALLTVREKLKFSPRPVSRGLELGKTGRLHCRATGTSPPIVHWVRLTASGRLQDWPAHVSDLNGTLLFQPVRETDGGTYSCVASNAQGLINATVNVTVVESPRFLAPPTGPTEAVVGRPLLLDCPVYGRPEPSVQWDRNSKLAGLDSSRFVVLENGSLYIRELQYGDEARYGCIAGNSGGFSRQEIQLIVRSSEADLSSSSPGSREADDGALMTRTVMITVSAAAAYLLLVAGLTAWCRYRRRQRKQQYLRSPAEGTSGLLSKTEAADAVGLDSRARYVGFPGSGGEATSARASSPSVYNSPSAQTGYHSYQSIRSETDSQRSKRSTASVERMLQGFSRQELLPVMPLGQGEFGEVYLARVQQRRRDPADSDPIVMVKALQSLRDEAALKQFARETELYGGGSPHPGLVRLLAVCRDRPPNLMVLEYTDWGDLKQFLLATRPEPGRGPPRPPPLSSAQSASLCHQVAAGLEHLHSRQLTHRDVATRNCLITSSLEVKLSCGRLCRDTYSAEYCRLRGRVVPIRWQPAEAALDAEYTPRADAWCWAVLCWEVFRRAELPHAALSDDQLTRALAREGAPPQLVVPDNTPGPLAAVMRRCWSPAAHERPLMPEVLRALAAVVNTDE